MSTLDWWGPFFICRKIKKTRPMKARNDGKVFICQQSRHCHFNVIVGACLRSLRTSDARKERTLPGRLGTKCDLTGTEFSICLQNKCIPCIWYVVSTYHSPVSVFHVTDTYCIRITPVYHSRLGRNRYGANTYLPSSYSASEYLFRKHSVATSLVMSHQNHPNLECYHAVLRRPITERFRIHSFSLQ